MKIFSTFIPGTPKPGGSKKFVGFAKKTGRAVIVDACKKNGAWREFVAAIAYAEHEYGPQSGPIRAEFTFITTRPKAHFGAAGIKPRFLLAQPITRPDVLKLTRSVEDALTGIVWVDDGQITHETIIKRYAGPDEETGVQISVFQNTVTF